MNNNHYRIKSIILLSLCLLAGKVFSNNQIIKSVISKNWDNHSIETIKLLYLENNINYYRLGLVFLAHDDYLQAITYLKKANHVHAKFYLALSYYKLNNLELARKYIQDYIVLNKSNSTFSLYIDILNDLGDTKGIEVLLQKLDTRHETLTIEVLYKQGKSYLSLGQCEKAIAMFQLVLKKSPASTKVNKLMSKAYQQCEQPILAHEYMLKDANGVVVSNDALLVNLYEYGNPASLLKPKMLKLIDKNKYSEALLIAEKLIKIHPKDETIWINYGSLLKNLNEFSMAIAAYEKAYELNPRNELAVENIIKSYWKNDKNKIIIWLNILLDINPKHRVGLRIKGDILKSKNDIKGAIKYYTFSLKQSPEDAYLLKQLTLIYLNRNMEDTAIEMLDNAFKISSKNVTIANYLARTLMISQYENEDSRKRALRISRTIFRLKSNYINKFTLLMALRINKLEKEADKILLELKDIPLNQSQKKYKDALIVLEDYDKLIENINPDWMW